MGSRGFTELPMAFFRGKEVQQQLLQEQGGCIAQRRSVSEKLPAFMHEHKISSEGDKNL